MGKAAFPKTFPPGKGQLLYTKSKVYVHLTASKKDNIPGYLVIVKPFADSSNTDFVVAFIPESDVNAEDRKSLDYFDLYGLDGENYDFYGHSGDSTTSTLESGKKDKDKDRPKVARFIERPKMSSVASYAFGLAISNIYSIQVRPKTTRLWEGSIIIHPKDVLEGIPGLFFHDDESPGTKREQKLRSKQFNPFAENSKGDLYWGGDRFVSCMKNYCVMEESTVEKGMYLVNPSKEDTINFIPNVLEEQNKKNAADQLKQSKGVGESMEILGKAVGNFMNNTKWKVLTGLASVTTYAKQQLNGLSTNESIPAPIRRLMDNSPQVKVIGEDFDSANEYLAKWALSVQEEADRSRKRIIGNDYYKQLIETEFPGGSVKLTLQEVAAAQRMKPVSEVEMKSLFDSSGRIQITLREVLDRLFHGGVEPEARKDAWLFLLKVYSWDTSSADREQLLKSYYSAYIEYKNHWKGDLAHKTKSDHWQDQRARIEKDVRRTDRELKFFGGSDDEEAPDKSPVENPFKNPHLNGMRDILLTYNEFNGSLGYVQGMSDLLSPLYYVIQDEPLTFWAFTRFMEVMERNFVSDLSGMKDQMLTLTELVQFMMPALYEHLEKCDSGNLFFFFRMLLVWFKRELSFTDTMRLWEVLWTNYESSQFILFFCLAILEKHSKIILQNLDRFDSILKYMNDLSGTLDVDDLLVRAELLFMKFKQMTELIDRRNAGLGFSAVEDESKGKVHISKQLRMLLSAEPVLEKEKDKNRGESEEEKRERENRQRREAKLREKSDTVKSAKGDRKETKDEPKKEDKKEPVSKDKNQINDPKREAKKINKPKTNTKGRKRPVKEVKKNAGKTNVKKVTNTEGAEDKKTNKTSASTPITENKENSNDAK